MKVCQTALNLDATSGDCGITKQYIKRISKVDGDSKRRNIHMGRVKDKRGRLVKTRTEQQKPTTTTTITKQNQTKPKQLKTSKHCQQQMFDRNIGAMNEVWKKACVCVWV